MGLIQDKKIGVKTNHGLKFSKKNGFVSNGVSDLIGERKKKMVVKMTMDQNLVKKNMGL